MRILIMMKNIVLCCMATMITGSDLLSSWAGLSGRAVKVVAGSSIAGVVSGTGAYCYQDHVQSEQKLKEMEQMRQKQESQLEIEKIRRVEAELRAYNQRSFNDWINKNIDKQVANEQKISEKKERLRQLDLQSRDLYFRNVELDNRQRVLDLRRREMESRQAQQVNRSKISELLK